MEAVRVIEMHMSLSRSAMGILLSFSSVLSIRSVLKNQLLEDIFSGMVSEATLIYYFRKHFSFFLVKTRIMHNTDNLRTVGRVGRLQGFSGFLVVHTSTVKYCKGESDLWKI